MNTSAPSALGCDDSEMRALSHFPGSLYDEAGDAPSDSWLHS